MAIKNVEYSIETWERGGEGGVEKESYFYAICYDMIKVNQAINVYSQE